MKKHKFISPKIRSFRETNFIFTRFFTFVDKTLIII